MRILKRNWAADRSIVPLSHTHYDHAGGIPYLRQEWPALIVCGSAHGKAVLEKPNAQALIRKLGNTASPHVYGRGPAPLAHDDALLRIDRVQETAT